MKKRQNENFLRRSKKIQELVTYLEKERLSLFAIFLIVFLFGLIRGVFEVLCVECPCSELLLRGLISNDISTSLSAFFGGTLVMYLFTREDIRKIWNAAIFGWVLFFIPPIFDVLFYGSCPGYWGFAKLEHLVESGLGAFFIPLFLADVGFSPGLIFMGVGCSVLVFIYCGYKTNSWKKTMAFMAAIYAFVLFEIAAPFTWYIPSDLGMGLGLIPYPFEWYFYLFLTWGTVLLAIKRDFAKDLVGNMNKPMLLGIPAVTVFGIWWSVPYPFHSVYFITLAVMSSFVWISFSIISKVKLTGKKGVRINVKEKIKKSLYAFSGGDRYDYGVPKSHLSIALILQFSVIYFGILYGHVADKIMVMYLMFIGVLLPYLYLLSRRLSDSALIKSIFFGFIVSLSFLLGYFKRIIDNNWILSNDAIFLTIALFAVFFIATYYKSKKIRKTHATGVGG